MKPLNIAIVGCGGVGRKRAMQMPLCGEIVCCDTRIDRVNDLAADLCAEGREADVSFKYSDAVSRKKVDAVIVATTHDMLAPVAIAAIQAGKHVLIEKPGACSLHELEEIERQAHRHNVSVTIGFNHRYHPGFLKAMELWNEGAIGTGMMVRGRYGHGGRLGYEKEWRGDPARGGGELLDQGVHIIDLAQAFLGKFSTIVGRAKTLFWMMDVDDNAFMILENARGQIAHLHVSCTEWRNTFSFEIYGTAGKLHWEGLGGSYGVERLTYYRMLPQMGPPETTIYEFPQADESWRLELEAFFASVRSGLPVVDVSGAREALRVVEEIRLQSYVDAGTVETAQ